LAGLLTNGSLREQPQALHERIKMLIGDVLAITTQIANEFPAAHPQFVVSENPDGWFHIQGEGWTTDLSGSSPIYQIGAVTLERLAAGRRAFIRVRPEVNREKDFQTDDEVTRSYVRFSFRDEPGEWDYPSEARNDFTTDALIRGTERIAYKQTDFDGVFGTPGI
jgi:hypothetical protein